MFPSLSHVPTEFQGEPQDDTCCNTVLEMQAHVEILVNNFFKKIVRCGES